MKRSQSIIMKVFLSGMLGLGVSAVQAQSGSLEPPSTAVDGGGNPVATTQTQPSWDQKLPVSERFVRVLPTAATPEGEGVLDRETGVVWEQTPVNVTISFGSALGVCLRSAKGGRRGWSLPSIHQLNSLYDPGNLSGNPDLPLGHPFTNVSAVTTYWSSTTTSFDSTVVWALRFDALEDSGSVQSLFKSGVALVWCVRGQDGLSVY